MKDLLRKGFTLLKSVTKKGFFEIIVGNTLVKAIAALSGLFVPRLLSTYDYGLLAFVDTVITYILLANGLGLIVAILRYCSLHDDPQKKKAIYCFALKWGVIFDAVLITVSIPLILSLPLPFEEARVYLLFAAGLPMVTLIFESFSIYLRANFENKRFAKLSVIFTVFSAGLQILLAWGFKVYGALSARYIAYIIASGVGFWMVCKATGFLKTEKSPLDKNEKKDMVKYAIGAMFAAAFSIIMPLNEQFMISLLLKNEEISGLYRAATLLPANLQFITMSVVVFIFPYFARHSNDGQWIWKRFLQMTAGLAVVMGSFICICLLFTPQITQIVFGEEYMGAVGTMRLMWVTFGINAVFRMPSVNLLAAIGMVKFSTINSIVSAIVHIILDYFFITRYGFAGAAMALTVAYGLSSVINFVYLKIKTNELIKNQGVLSNESNK